VKKRFVIAAACGVAIGIIILKNKTKASYVDPCIAIRTMEANPETGADKIAPTVNNEVKDLHTSNYGAQMMGDFKKNTYTTCLLSDGSVREIKITTEKGSITVERKEAAIEGSQTNPTIDGEAWLTKVKLVPGSPAYKNAAELFSNYQAGFKPSPE
jgi:hypothetical protein